MNPVDTNNEDDTNDDDSFLRIRTPFSSASSSTTTTGQHPHPHQSQSPPTTGIASVAFIGNSMLYFNDFPRFFQQLAFASASNDEDPIQHDETAPTPLRVVQNSCLHGGASISSMLLEGNAMYPQFRTPNAIIKSIGKQQISTMERRSNATDDDDDDTSIYDHSDATTAATTSSSSSSTDDDPVLYDYGACTVPQLLLGRDDRLMDPGYAVESVEDAMAQHNQTNPCRQDALYLSYAIAAFDPDTNTNDNNDDDDDGANAKGSTTGSTPNHRDPFVSSIPSDWTRTAETTPPTTTKNRRSNAWDYVVINDNTRNPSQFNTRARALANLERFYVPWFLETGATPVLLWTHAYTPATTGPCVLASHATATTSNNNTNSSTTTTVVVGLDNVPNFTSLTYVGYQEYAKLLAQHLPPKQQPRIAPVGLAFLTVYEERFDLWQQLFHCDGVHASPSGTFLQGCIVYYTLFGRMPNYHHAVVGSTTDTWNAKNGTSSSLWQHARMMQHVWEPENPLPDRRMADYLYCVAQRVMRDKHIPTSFIPYYNGEFAYSYSYFSSSTASSSSSSPPP